MGRGKIVFEESYAEPPAPFFAFNIQALWQMNQETKQLRIINFEWNAQEWLTEKVQDRTFKLPSEIEVKRESYSDKNVRRKMAQSLLQSLKEQGS